MPEGLITSPHVLLEVLRSLLENVLVHANATRLTVRGLQDAEGYRIDWLDKNSYWFLNNKQVAANTYSVPTTVSAGTLAVGHNTALSTGASSWTTGRPCRPAR